jgi:hypothetical protein
MITASQSRPGARAIAAAGDEAVARWRELEKRHGEPQAAPALVAPAGAAQDISKPEQKRTAARVRRVSA